MEIASYDIDTLTNLKAFLNVRNFPRLFFVRTNASPKAPFPIDCESFSEIFPSSDIHSFKWSTKYKRVLLLAQNFINTESIAVFPVSTHNQGNLELCRTVMSFLEYLASSMKEGEYITPCNDYVDDSRNFILGHSTHLPTPTGIVKSAKGDKLHYPESDDMFRWEAHAKATLNNIPKDFLKDLDKELKEDEECREWLLREENMKQEGVTYMPSAKRARESFADDKGLLLLDTAGGWPVAFAVEFLGSAVVVLPEKADAMTFLIDKINADTSERKGFELLRHVFSEDAPPLCADSSTISPDDSSSLATIKLESIDNSEDNITNNPDCKFKISIKGIPETKNAFCTAYQFIRILVCYYASQEGSALLFKEKDIRMLSRDMTVEVLPGSQLLKSSKDISKTSRKILGYVLFNEDIFKAGATRQEKLKIIDKLIDKKLPDNSLKKLGYTSRRLKLEIIIPENIQNDLKNKKVDGDSKLLPELLKPDIYS